MAVRLLPGGLWDIGKLLDSLRQSDREETLFTARALGHWHPGWTLAGMFASERPDCWAMFSNGAFLGLIGIRPLPECPSAGLIWFLGTVEADRQPVALTKGCRRFIDMQRDSFSAMGNVVPQHMVERIRWLSYMGFDIIDEEAQLLPEGMVSFWLTSR